MEMAIILNAGECKLSGVCLELSEYIWVIIPL